MGADALRLIRRHEGCTRYIKNHIVARVLQVRLAGPTVMWCAEQVSMRFPNKES